MADPLIIAAGEIGVLRVFAVDIDPSDREAILTPRADMAPTGAALGMLLGVDWIDPERAELFDVTDLEDLGLAGFLTQGAGVNPQEIAKARAQLDAATGTVLITYSKAFGPEARQLGPARSVQFLGLFHEEKSAVAFETLPSKSATQQDKISDATDPPQQAHLTVLLAIVMLPMIVLVLGLIAFLLLR